MLGVFRIVLGVFRTEVGVFRTVLGVFRTGCGVFHMGDVFEKPSRMRKEGAKQLCHLHGFVLIALIAFVRSLTARVIVGIWVMNGDNAECLSLTAP